MAGSTRLLLVAFAVALLGTFFFLVSGGEPPVEAAIEREVADVLHEGPNEDPVDLAAVDRPAEAAREVVVPAAEEANGPNGSAAPAPMTPATVHGTVTLPPGFPTGADIEITGWNRDPEMAIAPPKVIAQADGSWSFDSLVPGNWTFTARVAHEDRLGTGRSDPLELAAGEDRRNVRIAMREYVVMGTVTDSAGAPLRGLRVSYDWSGAEPALREASKSQDPWRVSISNLPVGGQNVSFGRLNAVTTWANPTASDVRISTVQNTEAGEERILEMVKMLEVIQMDMRNVELSGEVNSLEGLALESFLPGNLNPLTEPAHELFFAPTDHASGEVTTDDAGRFRIPLEGRGEVSITAPAHTDQPSALEAQFLRTSQSVEVTEQAPSAMVEFMLLRAATVNGHVMRSDGTKSSISVFLRPEGKSTKTGTTDDEGAFEFARLRPGKHNFYARSGGDSGQEFSVALVLELREGENRYINDVLTASSSVQGVLQNPSGQPLTGVKITAFGADNDNLKRTGTTDEHGFFRIVGMYAGDYVLSLQGFSFGDKVEAYAPPRGAVKDIGVLTATRKNKTVDSR